MVSQLAAENTGGFHGKRIALADTSDGCQLVNAFDNLKRIVGNKLESSLSFITGSQGKIQKL